MKYVNYLAKDMDVYVDGKKLNLERSSMNLLTYAARRFDVPLTHTINRPNWSCVYCLKEIKFTKGQLVAVYGDELGNVEFEVILRGES